MAGPARLTPTGLQPGSAESFSTFISGVPAAKTPFTGSERVPMIQGGFTVYAPPGSSGFGPPVRTILTANTNYYVATGGSDSANGLSPATAWATLQHAANFIASFIDIANFAVVINIGSGLFRGADIPAFVGGGSLLWKGNGSVNTTINDGPSHAGSFNISGNQTNILMDFMKVSPNLGSPQTINIASGVVVTFATDFASFTINDFVIDAQNVIGILATGPCLVFTGLGTGGVFHAASGNFFIYGWQVLLNASVQDFANWQITGTPGFTSAFIQVADSAAFQPLGTYTGAATGQRFQVNGNASIDSGTLGALGPNFFPGNSAGFVDSTSDYDGFQGPSPGINTQTGAGYTAALTDFAGRVEMNNAGANTFTIPTNATVAFPISPLGLLVVQTGAGATTIAGAGGVTAHNAGAVGGQWKAARVYQRATDEWVQTNA